MAIDVTPVIAELLARNRGPDPRGPEHRQSPNYGVSATLEGDVLAVELTFRAGSVYCCYEWGCHVGFTPLAKRWDNLRARLLEHGILPPARFELRRTCVIEESAIFFDLFKPDRTRRCWYEFAPVSAHRYEWGSIEVSSEDGDAELVRT